MELVGVGGDSELIVAHRQWVAEVLGTGEIVRESKWTESIAVGSSEFVEEVKEELGMRAAGRSVLKNTDGHELREPGSSYGTNFGLKNGLLSFENAYLWEVIPDISES